MKLCLFLLSLFGLYGCSEGQCGFRDTDCEKAQEFSERAQAACYAINFTADICIQDALQLKRRFAGYLITNNQFESTCNNCSEKACSRDEVPDFNCQMPDTLPDQTEENITDFLPKFYWHQDVPSKTKKGEKFEKCCVTTKRSTPLTWRCGANCFVVMCPIAGGYQWVDEVVCDIKTQEQKEKYGAKYESRNKCKKPCRTAFTKRLYLVTNKPPEGWFGHCFYWWLPMWFKVLNVPTHCYCPLDEPQLINVTDEP